MTEWKDTNGKRTAGRGREQALDAGVDGMKRTGSGGPEMLLRGKYKERGVLQV
jgi:hypothetical protein